MMSVVPTVHIPRYVHGYVPNHGTDWYVYVLHTCTMVLEYLVLVPMVLPGTGMAYTSYVHEYVPVRVRRNVMTQYQWYTCT